MLKKLLNYDLKHIFKFLLIFYSLSLFFGILTRIFLSIENSLMMEIIGKICSGAAISMMFSIVINNLMRLWVRFKNNLYGDESYLTHTLPVKKETLYNSKIITAFISMFVSILVIVLTVFIAYYSKENFEFIKNLLLSITDMFGNVTFIIIGILIVLFLEFANILQCGFTGIILGHKMNQNKVGYSVLFGFVVYMVSQIFVLICLFITALFNKEIMNLFFTNEVISFDSLKMILYIALIIYLIVVVIIYFVNIKLFKKGVNVD